MVWIYVSWFREFTHGMYPKEIIAHTHPKKMDEHDAYCRVVYDNNVKFGDNLKRLLEYIVN